MFVNLKLVLIAIITIKHIVINASSVNTAKNTAINREENDEENELIAQALKKVYENVANLNVELEVHLGWRYLKALLNAAEIVKKDEEQSGLLILTAGFYVEAAVSETAITLDIYEFLKTDLVKRLNILRPLEMLKRDDDHNDNDEDKTLKRKEYFQMKIDFIIAHIELAMRLSNVIHFNTCFSRAISQCAHVLRRGKKISTDLLNFIEFFARRLSDERRRSVNASKRMTACLRRLLENTEIYENFKQLLDQLNAPEFLEEGRYGKSANRPLANSESAFEQIYAAYVMQIYAKNNDLSFYNEAENHIDAKEFLSVMQIDDSVELLMPVDTFVSSIIDEQSSMIKQVAQAESLKPEHRSTEFHFEIEKYFKQIPDLKSKLATIVRLRHKNFKIDLKNYKLYLSEAQKTKSELKQNPSTSNKCALAIGPLFDIHASFWHHKFNIHDRVKNFATDLLMIKLDLENKKDETNSLLDYENNHARLLLSIPSHDRLFVLSIADFLSLFGDSLLHRLSLEFTSKIPETKYKRMVREANSACRSYKTALKTLKLVENQRLSSFLLIGVHKALISNSLNQIMAEPSAKQSYFCMMSPQSVGFTLSALFGFIEGPSTLHFDHTRREILLDGKHQLFCP